MAPGFALQREAVVLSCNGAVTLAHQADGNVVLYRGGTALWSTNTYGYSTANFVMQLDGNLVLYDPSGIPLWHSATGGYPGAWAAVQDDCNFVIYYSSSPIWATGTWCQ